MDEFKLHIIEKIVDEAGADGIDESSVEIPPDPKMGDYAFPCFTLSKKLKKAPPMIAEWLKAKIKPDDVIEKVENAGPYLNFFVRRAMLAETTLKEVFEKRGRYGSCDLGKGGNVVIDFSSPNIAKPFGIGHLRSTVIGNSIYRLHNFAGYKSVGVNHLGDWGTQFGKLIVAFKNWGTDKELEKEPIAHLFNIYVKFHEEAKIRPELEDEARAWFKKLEDGNKEALQLWEMFKNLSLEEFKRYYTELDIHFDSWHGEAFYNDKMEAVVEKLKKKNLLTLSEGAQIVEVGEDMPPGMVKKSDGATMYLTRDLAAALYRLHEYKPAKLLYVVGSPQKLHFRQLFKTLEMMGERKCDMVHVEFGHYLGMKTREGNIIFLEEVLDKALELAKKIIKEKNPDLADKEEVAKAVGVGAIIFGDLVNDRVRDMEFSWDRMLSFEGETGPYVQYAHARICSILRKHGKKPDGKADCSVLKEDIEKELVKKVYAFKQVVVDSAESYKPHLLAHHLVELGQMFNTFYTQCPVLKADSKKLVSARLLLCDSVRQVLANGLYLLGLKAPEEM
ncbi:MAG: arginine--tRNA ligase [Nanoarchaeota archaeon]|nr:arginine--tRNA ligase [Nanoarchaeota archaeon]